MPTPIPPPLTPADNRPAGSIRSADDIEILFGQIVRRYDTMNRLMTGGRDGVWRRMVARAAVMGGRDGRVLDVATGTGDLAIALAGAGARSVTGIDISQPMLDAAAAKVASRSATGQALAVELLHGDAMRLPFDDDTFDACTVSFGLRNMPDYAAAIAEMVRVLRPGGRWVCLELTPFRVPVLRAGFGLYFERVVPIVGGVISGERDAYRYLPNSVQHFPPANELVVLMQRAGLVNTRYRLLGGGTVAMHTGEKSWPGA
ncbi:MAG: Demethylmenaquinone methyltransferase [uncultured Thermomicrobiales bacterium]|uniref:Demethylmenaquinone methyltransferase n=1 Tax=uncultured Thermomicrobiales bacterium TaxID=1645740 RepID=A0A6J4VBQ7_9BACT|nr:MAG: Demethylmenaquinone methyltransferase [uncultured Thermomicrobiales bacterium]